MVFILRKVTSAKMERDPILAEILSKHNISANMEWNYKLAEEDRGE